MLKSTLFSIFVALTCSNALAKDYYVVVPVKGHTPAADAISVALAQLALPAGTAGVPYAGVDLTSLLVVTGDPNYTPSSVKWSIESGSLPSGLSLGPDGSLRGTPTTAGNSTFQVRATYKTKSGVQSYQVAVALTVNLAAGTPPGAVVGVAYRYDLAPLLAVTGEPSYDASSAVWAAGPSSLPAGLVLTSGGAIAGTPTAAGSGALTVRVTYKGVSSVQTYQVVSSYSTLKIVSASYGANLGFTDNRTAYLASLCDGKTTCTIPTGALYSAAAGGDPRSGVGKSLVIQYTCAGLVKPTYNSPAEASYHDNTLSCP